MVLIDTSGWVEFFNGNEATQQLNELIESNTICTNNLILTELLPPILHQQESELKHLMLSINRLPMSVDWSEIIRMQHKNITHGINNIGITDMIIMQNALQHNVEIFTFNQDLHLIADIHGLEIYKAMF
ncbi:MAG: PIN domain-containing protein [Spirochaetales bacterium]|nr:PIN domain-containing protein [Spirochaetales bacterium]